METVEGMHPFSSDVDAVGGTKKSEDAIFKQSSTKVTSVFLLLDNEQ